MTALLHSPHPCESRDPSLRASNTRRAMGPCFRRGAGILEMWESGPALVDFGDDPVAAFFLGAVEQRVGPFEQGGLVFLRAQLNQAEG